MVEHSPDGAFGLVLNRPSETTVGEASPELAELIGDDHLLHVGGPVQPNAVTAIGEHPDPATATKLIVGSVGMVDLDDPPELPASGSSPATRAGGLASSTASSSRRPGSSTRPTPTIPSAVADLWPEVLARKGGEFALLARMPPDPSVN